MHHVMNTVCVSSYAAALTALTVYHPFKFPFNPQSEVLGRARQQLNNLTTNRNGCYSRF